MKLSAVVITKNEEEYIERCLKSLKFCDEIIIIDDFSTDNTVQVAKRMGAIVYKRRLNNDFAAQKNYGLEKTNGKWILSIDADEIVSKKLQREIITSVNELNSNISGFYLQRSDLVLGYKMKGTELGKKKLLRLAKKDAGKWERVVHEQWNINGSIGELKAPIFHNSHKNLHEFIETINNYSVLHADANQKENKKATIFKIIFWPKFKFIDNFLLKKGYDDKTFGFVVSMIMAFHSFLAWSALWLNQRKNINR
jgi:glycosyltransferase involved in cell wall biosynthesis